MPSDLRTGTGPRWWTRLACWKFGCDPGFNPVWATTEYQQSTCRYCGRSIHADG